MDNSFLHSKKLLLVDDEPELLKMVSAILADEDFWAPCDRRQCERGNCRRQSGKT